MTTYVDTSALLKLYLKEADSHIARSLIKADPVLVTSWLTVVEVRRTLAANLNGVALAQQRAYAEHDLDAMALVNPDEVTWRAAANIGEVLGVRSLDALHLATAQRIGVSPLAFCTFDLRQGQAARQLGFHVIGC